MTDTGTTTCARHPDVETRLRCSSCETPICPRCAVQTPVGQKCPACAQQARSATRQGKPDQYLKASLFGAGATILGAIIVAAIHGAGGGFFRWIVTGGVGFGIAAAVRRGADGNGNPPFRYLSYGLTVVAVLTGLLFIFRTPLPSVLTLVTYLAGVYGAHMRFNR